MAVLQAVHGKFERANAGSFIRDGAAQMHSASIPLVISAIVQDDCKAIQRASSRADNLDALRYVAADVVVVYLVDEDG